MTQPSIHLPPYFVDAQRKLEYDKVVERISKLAFSESGRQQTLRLTPQIDRTIIEQELRKVSEAKELLIAETAIPLDGFKNIVAALKKTTVENQVLSLVELLEIAATIRVSRSLKVFLVKRASQYPAIGIYHQQLFADKIIEHHIDEALDERGFVKDSASRELRDIRRSMIGASDALRKRLESILRNVAQQEFLQDDIITTRDGRFVIPIKSEYKHSVPGFIHSSSSSGATVFIEPAESLELNNALRELQLREQREIHRILADLTKQVSEIREPLAVSYSALTELDVIFARGKYSIELCGNPPVISAVPCIKLFNARHPILLQHLKREKTVPLSIELGGETQTLIITGPNAGGKTVTMKTVGLLALCAQAGIHIPADSESELFPFQKIFVDIGDDQSIENDLSSFSSHLHSLHNILEEADALSLVLIDEIGTGTDPSEGGALAAVVLQDLTARQAITIATTHHGILKVFAHETLGMDNASMEFDQESLSPTYRFRSGIPGSSYAFELAERLGISHTLLNRARTQMGDEKTKLESLILELERQGQEYQHQLRQTAKEKEHLESMILSYEQKTTQLKRELGTIRKKAIEEAKEIVQQAQLKVERSVKEIRESGAQREIVRSSHQVLKKLGEDLEKFTLEEQTTPPNTELIEKGDIVRIRDGHEKGEVIEIHGKHAIVLCGDARLRITLTDLHKEQKQPKQYSSSSSTTPAPEAANEIDLRGLFGDEAIAQVQTFLDNAYAAGLHRVDIIHGKGTGALRKRISDFVKMYPHVKAFRLGEWNEGGTGVTVVELN
ncbi:MAG: endonuclease MutS2 [Ignavibacteriales bacterium]|nr:endonuclease MutS2 [Ignavibacteriales bacterium]